MRAIPNIKHWHKFFKEKNSCDTQHISTGYQGQQPKGVGPRVSRGGWWVGVGVPQPQA
jgi:hypothetical protein